MGLGRVPRRDSAEEKITVRHLNRQAHPRRDLCGDGPDRLRGATYHNNDQLRRIAYLRNYRGDRVRTCKEQKILDPDATPLIAIRGFILSRKSLGGLQTDLGGRVLGGESILTYDWMGLALAVGLAGALVGGYLGELAQAQVEGGRAAA